MKESKQARSERHQREEWQMVELLRLAGNVIEAEHSVREDRKWRVDYLLNGYGWPAPIAVEIQGFGFGHVGRSGWLRDIEKCQAIAANGWLYLPVTREDISNGNALEALARCGVRVEPIATRIESGK